jgi:cob(I)alamin adenosyltransferase
MILVITGNGKGKTTSALGTAIRALGWGNRVAVVFFDKGGSHYGEGNIFDFLQYLNSEKTDISKSKLENRNSSAVADCISDFDFISPDVFRFGLERFDEEKKEFRFKNTEGDKEEVKRGIDKVFTLYKEKYFLIVCDELITCLNSGLIDDKSVQKLADECPKDTHLLLTGRGAPDWLVEKADLVSDVKEVKHYFKKGESAVKGLDY